MAVNICVIGAGASGISSAHYLKKLGFNVEIIETTNQIGGRMGSALLGNRRVDFGGKNIGKKYDLVRRFFSELGNYEYEFFGVNTAVPGPDGKLVRINSANKLGTALGVLKMVGLQDSIQLLNFFKEISRSKDNGFLGGPLFRELSEKMDHAPLTEHYNHSFCWNLLRMVVMRNNGAEPDEYYTGNLGTNIKMMMDSFDQPVRGIYTILGEFENRNNIKYNHAVVEILTRDGKICGAKIKNNDTGEISEREYDGVIVATPARACAPLVAPILPELVSGLDKVVYNPVALAVVQYDQPVFNQDIRAIGFGPKQPISNAGAYGIHDLDLVRYTFSSRASRAVISESTTGGEVVDIAEREMRALGMPIGRRLNFTYKYFKHGLSSYSPYHHRLLDNMETSSAKIRGLAFAGDYIRGVSLEGCFRASWEVTRQKILKDLGPLL